jgi:hypothetical protein
MKSFLLLLALTAGGSGCTDDDIALVIKHLAAPEPPDCTADPGGTVSQSRGVLDVGVVQAGTLRGYTLAPVVVNNLLVPTGVGVSPETNTVTLVGFDVQLKAAPNDPELTAALATVPTEFHVPLAGGRIPPGGTSMVAVFIEVVPRDVARVMASAIANAGPRSAGPLTVHFRPVGQRAGLKINGGYTDYPIDVCEFCLTTPPMPCPAGGFDTAAIQAAGCFPQQDAVVTCCTSGSTLLCGDQVPKKTTMM